MLTPPDIRNLLKDRNLKEVSRASGVPYFKIYNLLRRGNEPSYKTVKALSDYLKAPAA